MTGWRVPNLLTAALGALLWALILGINAHIALWRLGWETAERVWEVTALFAFGGALAFPVAHCLCSLGRARLPAQRFAVAFLAFAILTVGFTATAYALQYRLYYAEWHGRPFSLSWSVHFLFTTLGAFYQFAVLGLRFYFPWALALLFVLSFLYARRAR